MVFTLRGYPGSEWTVGWDGSMRAGRPVRSYLGIGGKMADFPPTQPPQTTYLLRHPLAGYLSSAPTTISALRCAQSWLGWTHQWALCPPASVGFGQWRRGVKEPELWVFVLLLLPERSPWTGSSFNQRPGGPVHSPLSLQVLHLLRAITHQA